jgi:DNA-binding XRE family transcriptional regulator
MESTTTVSNLMLKVARVKMGLSQGDMAGMLHISKGSYAGKENNIIDFKLNEMLETGRIVKLSLNDLFN